ncbi:MAG: hypothetical protein ABSE87_01820 [Terracidiphilus sp.]|jgi:hypothetical protein
MRRIPAAFFLVAFTAVLAAQTPPAAEPKPPAPKAPLAPPQVVKDLPVRKVVLYKNGVGYFEHAGSVQGNQHVAIDFTSQQLNDVLQSLTFSTRAAAASPASITTPPLPLTSN